MPALLALSLVLVVAPARAQGAPPRPGRIGDVRGLEVPGFLARRQALVNRAEWVQGDERVYLRGSLVPDAGALDPQLVWRKPGLDLVIGTQMLAGATPFHDLTSIRGVRAAGEDGPWTWSAWAGQTWNPDLRLSRGIDKTHALAGVTVGYRPDPYQSWGASMMPYAQRAGGGMDRVLVMGQGYVTDRRTWALHGGYGQDLGGGDAGGRQAVRALAGYSDGRLTVGADYLDVGRHFGPPQGVVDLRGQRVLSAVMLYRFDDRLSLLETYRSLGQGLDDGRTVSSSSWQHSLVWQASPTVALRGGWEHPGRAFLEGTARVSPVVLTGSLSHVVGKGLRARLRVDAPLGEDTSLYAERAWQSAGDLTRLGVRASMLDGRGTARLEYLTSGFASASMEYRLGGRTWLGASLGGGTGTTSASGWVRCVLDRHTQVVLEHRTQTPAGTYLVEGRPTPLGSLTSLSVQTSWGGDMQSALERELAGKAIVRVEGLRAGGGGTRPLEGVRVRLGDRVVATDRRGTAVFDGLAEGKWQAEVLADSLGDNREVDGDPVQTLDVPAGDAAKARFRVTEYASVYACAFNDAGGTGRAETGFVPFPGLSVRLDEADAAVTGGDGGARFARLAPGRYRVALEGAPAGLEATTPLTREVVLEPGQEAVVAFGLRGFGRLRGTARCVPHGGAEATEPLAGCAVLVDGQVAGTSGDDGSFDTSVPAGHHRVTLDPIAVGGNRTVEGEPLQVDVPAGGGAALDVVVSELAEIRGRVSREGRPLGGVAVLLGESYAYTDDQGRFRFPRLRRGRHQVDVDGATLPAGLSAASVEVVLAPGAVREIELEVRK